MNTTFKRTTLSLVFSLAFVGIGYGQRPVTFFHGLNRPAFDWAYATQQLQQQFIYNSRLEPYNSSYAVPTIAQQEHSPLPTNSVVVGHSLGGIVGREMVRQYGTSKVSALITAGSPHLGAEVTRHIDNGDLAFYINIWTTDLSIGWYQLGYPTNIVGDVLQVAGVYAASTVNTGYQSGAALDLRPNSSFMQTLNSNPAATLPTDHYTIYGTEDWFELPRLAGAFVRSDHLEGPWWGYYKGAVGLYFGMFVLTTRLGWIYYNEYEETGDYYYYALSTYWYASANGFLRGLLALVDYIPREWYYMITGTTTRTDNDGLLPALTQAPLFVEGQRRLVSPQTNHQELLAHPNALDALIDAFDGVRVLRRQP